MVICKRNFPCIRESGAAKIFGSGSPSSSSLLTRVCPSSDFDSKAAHESHKAIPRACSTPERPWVLQEALCCRLAPWCTATPRPSDASSGMPGGWGRDCIHLPLFLPRHEFRLHQGMPLVLSPSPFEDGQVGLTKPYRLNVFCDN